MYFVVRRYLVAKSLTILPKKKKKDFKIKHHSNMENVLKIKSRGIRTKTRKLYFEI